MIAAALDDNTMMTTMTTPNKNLASYIPLTTVMDKASLDLDLIAIGQHLARNSHDGFKDALDIYSYGANSKPFAVLELDVSLAFDIAQGKGVFGSSNNENGMMLRGTVMETVPRGDKYLRVLYDVDHLQANFVSCRVGSNPEPMTIGCFAPDGTIEIDGLGEFRYQYDVLKNNKNDRSIQSFSVEAKEKMYSCDGPCPYKDYMNGSSPYKDYMRFVRYYDAFDYGNRFVSAGFASDFVDERESAPSFHNGSFNFYSMSMQGRKMIIQRGIVNLIIWMKVVQEMEKAVSICVNGKNCGPEGTDGNCMIKRVHDWDAAVAYYVGSSAETMVGDDGFLPFATAEEFCITFGTCSMNNNNKNNDYDNNEDFSAVNHEVLQLFREGQQALLDGMCNVTQAVKSSIVQQMTVPLVQATLRFAYWMDIKNDIGMGGEEEDVREAVQAEGVVFAASILPMIAACSPEDAETLLSNMDASREDYVATSFAEVKAILERHYDCMGGITCEQVGGLLLDENDDISSAEKWQKYIPGAEPCDYQKSNMHSLSTFHMIGVIVLIQALAVCGFFFCLPFCTRYSTVRRYKNNPDEVTIDDNGINEHEDGIFRVSPTPYTE